MNSKDYKYLVGLIVYAFFVPGLIYWLDLNQNIKYIQYILAAIVLHNIYHQNKFSSNYPEWKISKKYLTIMLFLALLAGNITIMTIQAFINQIFMFVPVLIYANIELDEQMFWKIARLFAVIFIINIIIAFYQSLVLKITVDYVSGTLGRSATPSIGILCSIVYSFSLGAFVLLKKKKYLYLFSVPILAILLLAEIKAGFVFLILNSFVLLLFPSPGSKVKTKAILSAVIIFLVSSIIVLYIFPVYYGNDYMTQVLTDKDRVLEYYGTQNYHDGRITRLDAFYKVYGDFFNDPGKLLIGYGVGATSTSSIFNVGMYGTNFGQLMYYYSMVSEVIFYLINYGLIGTIIFVLMNLWFMIASFKVSNRTDNCYNKLICYLSFTTQLVMLISFIIYARPFMSFYLTLISFGLVGAVARIRKTKQNYPKYIMS